MVEKIRRTGGQVNNLGLGFGIGKFNLIHVISSRREPLCVIA
jgi:hypothetical protein